jgi:hypothetical protein
MNLANVPSKLVGFRKAHVKRPDTRTNAMRGFSAPAALAGAFDIGKNALT